MPKNIKEISGVGFILFMITALAALILAVVNSVTAPVITENTIKEQNLAMENVFPGIENFEKAEVAIEDTELALMNISSIYMADDKGYVVMVNPNGYGGAISLVVGVDNDLKVTGINIIAQTETAGLGANCTNPDWQEQFKGKTENIGVAKGNASGNMIDAISSATITSKAVTKGVNNAITAVKTIKGDN